MKDTLYNFSLLCLLRMAAATWFAATARGATAYLYAGRKFNLALFKATVKSMQ